MKEKDRAGWGSGGVSHNLRSEGYRLVVDGGAYRAGEGGCGEC